MNFAGIVSSAQSQHIQRLERINPTKRRATKTEHEFDLVISSLRSFFPVVIQSDISSLQIRKAVSVTGISLGLLLTSVVFFQSTILLLGVPVIGGALICDIFRRRNLRAKKFEVDYPTFLLSLASAVRTGIDPVEAMIRCRELFDAGSVLVKELNTFKDSLEASNTSTEEALLQFGKTIHHPDLPLFRSALLLSTREGGSLSTCLYRLARVTRQRQSFRRRVRSTIALQKISALGILFCAGALVTIQLATNYSAFVAAYEHPIGKKIINLGFALMLTGAAWLMYMTRERNHA